MLSLSNSEFILHKENTSEKQINWKECLSHNTGQTSHLSNLFGVDLFRKAAEIRNDLAHNLLKNYWSAGSRGGYHRRCYLTCTSKRNLKFPLKGKMLKYQSQINQPNYLEHMAVQNVLFA